MASKMSISACGETNFITGITDSLNEAGEGETPTSFPGSLSYPYGRVGENPGNEVGGDSSTRGTRSSIVSPRGVN